MCSSDLEGTVLDDEAFTSILDGTRPFTGSYRPTSNLSVFDGENPAGVWNLMIEDVVPIDSGALTNWELEITLD